MLWLAFPAMENQNANHTNLANPREATKIPFAQFALFAPIRVLNPLMAHLVDSGYDFTTENQNANHTNLAKLRESSNIPSDSFDDDAVLGCNRRDRRVGLDIAVRIGDEVRRLPSTMPRVARMSRR